MTLEKVIVSLSQACSKPGVLFVALTRVRHPDCLLLEDDFPAFSTIRKQLHHPSFSARQRWERRMLVLFSRTIRQSMRNELWFSDDVRWSAPMSAVADTILRHWSANTELEGDAFKEHMHSVMKNDDQFMNIFDTVWSRMQQFPHCFELAAARGQLETLDMQGATCDTTNLTVCKTRFSFSGWKVDSADIHDYLAEGTLTESLLQGLYIVLRDRFPMNAYMFSPHLIRNSNLSRTLAQTRLKRKSTPEPLPDVSLFQYLTTRSRHCLLFDFLNTNDS